MILESDLNQDIGATTEALSIEERFERLREKKEKLKAEKTIEDAKERYNKTKEAAFRATKLIDEILSSLDDIDPMLSVLEKVLSPDGNQLILHTNNQNFDLIKSLMKSGENTYTLYKLAINNSFYDYINRSSKIEINSITFEQISSLRNLMDKSEYQKLLKSILLVFYEELFHLLEFNNFDKQLSEGKPIDEATAMISKKMQKARFNENTEKTTEMLIEADVTWYLLEKDFDISDSLWLENHRSNYGNENDVLDQLTEH